MLEIKAIGMCRLAVSIGGSINVQFTKTRAKTPRDFGVNPGLVIWMEIELRSAEMAVTLRTGRRDEPRRDVRDSVAAIYLRARW